VESKIPSAAKLIGLIIYSDATTLDTYGHSSSHPIYISLANIPMKRRSKYEAKALIGYLPIIHASSESQKKSNKFRLLIRETFQNCLKILFEPLLSQYQNGIHIYILKQIEWCYIAIANIIGDLPEIACYCLTSKSPKSNYPCPKCLVKNSNLSNISLTKEEMELRTNENMQETLNNNQCQEYSLIPIPNIFWKHK
jgi:hypothetical protein